MHCVHTDFSIASYTFFLSFISLKARRLRFLRFLFFSNCMADDDMLIHVCVCGLVAKCKPMHNNENIEITITNKSHKKSNKSQIKEEKKTEQKDKRHIILCICMCIY